MPEIGTRADEAILTDIERLMDQRTIERAKFFVRSNLAYVAQTLGTDEGKLSKRLTTFAPSYLVPWEPSTITHGVALLCGFDTPSL